MSQAVQNLIELQSDVVTSALTEVALRLERARPRPTTSSNSCASSSSSRPPRVIGSSRTRIAAVTIFKTAGREFRNVAKHTIELVYDKGKTDVEAAGDPCVARPLRSARPQGPARARKAAAVA